MKSSFNNFQIFAVPERDKALKDKKGDNGKELIIVWESAEESAELEAFLAKVLSAIQFKLDKDSLLVRLTPGENISSISLRQKHNMSYLISFGVDPRRLGLHFEHTLYQAFQHQGITYLFVDDLEAIFEERQEGGKQKSSALWKALQHIFLAKK